MRSFETIYEIAAANKGGAEALEALLATPLAPEEVAQISDDRWLAGMAKAVFQSGFSWKVIEAKWPGFEEAFDQFDVRRVAFYHDEKIEELVADTRIVRHAAKIKSVVDNASFLSELIDEHGAVGPLIANWPDDDFAGLVAMLAKRGARLGGATGQRMLRAMGRSSYILTPDVAKRLITEKVVAKAPSSKRDMAAAQEAFNTWRTQSGRSLTHISQVLAMSV